MEILTGQRLNKAAKLFRAAVILFSLLLIAILTLYFCVLIYAKILGAPPLAVPQSSLFYSEDGTLFAESHTGQKRYWTKLEDISPDMVAAVLAVEDRGFYQHNGFDYKRIAGAVFADVKAMSKVQGASTITQQYSRNLFLNHEKTWFRKLNEALYTVRIEMNYSKNEILEGYLNTIYFGHGAYGVQAASQYYFGKNAKDLTVAEAAMLAGIPKGPSHYSPFLSFENAKKRQGIVLASMASEKYIKKKQIQALQNEPITLNGHLEETKQLAPYFFDAVQQVLKSQLHLDEKTIALGGLKVYTTLDLHEQQIGEEAFKSRFSEDSDIQGALVAMNPKNGEVKALIGGRNYEESAFNRATQAVRQPGSTIKPLLYYSALEHGFTPTTMLKSEATTFTFDDGKASYTPHNFNSQYANKEISLAQAIALSDNIYAIKTHLFLGEKQLQNTAKKFGIQSNVEAVPASALGTSGVKVIEMVNAYSRIASGGKEIQPVFIKKVENHKGEVIYQAPTFTKEVLDRDQAFVLTGMLTGVFNQKLNGYASVTGSTIVPRLTRQYAGKSGSTQTDSWMIGYTPDLVAGVWTGYDQSKLMERTADKQYAKNIWADFMENSLSKSTFKKFKPSGNNVIGVKINPESGKIATKDCPVSVLTYFVRGTEPTEQCTLHLSSEEKEPKQQERKKPWYKKIIPFW
ncbi:transglycosylase domain-containing protein [Bacillus massiliigorillae]|uniref:transglycosylase domain-containing protein n=1 Tax=Bacillus massiliigorillae TaxID=1243664 RepID=UPI00039B0EB7|nr:PBP1A family penicillin-binding protein [Bacillus massiliigorillae]